MLSIIWLAAFVVLLIVEAMTLGLVTIWFACGALASFIVSLITDSIAIQIVVFIVVSLLMLICIRNIAVSKFNKKRLKTNVEGVVGKEAKVTETIDNFNGTGTVMLDGQEWTARSLNDNSVIEVGTRVLVREVKGVKLIVSE